MVEREPAGGRERLPAGDNAPPAPAAPRLPDAFGPQVSASELDWADELALDGQDVCGGVLTVPILRDVAVRGCRLATVRLTAAELTRSELVDVAGRGLDLSGTRWERARWRRVSLTDCRLSGADLSGATLSDLAVADGRADELSLRFATCERIAFTDTDLRGLDAYQADLRGASFTRCDLTGAQFGRAQCQGAVFRDCTLAGLDGVQSLAGASIASLDLMALSHLFAQALGIRILD